MDEGCGEDDTGTKLLQAHEQNALLRHARELGEENGAENTDSAGSQDDEEQPDAERFVVVSVSARTGGLCSTLTLTVTAYTVSVSCQSRDD